MDSSDRSLDTPSPIPDQTIGLTERLAFLELGDGDVQRLNAIAPRFGQFAEQFVDQFYEHLQSFDATARLLQDPQRVARLKLLQREYFESLLAAKWDGQYVQQRQSIGRAHADVGLDPQFFLGAYSQYVQHCFRKFSADFGSEAQGCAEQILSLMKVVFLDIGLTLDAYFSQSTEKLRQALDMYWRANHDLRQFAQLTSHDLKTPIATVANLCEETLDEFGEKMPAEAAQMIDAARERTFQISRMIDELLQSTLSFHSADSQDEVSSESVLKEVVERLKPTLDDNNVEVQLPRTLPYVWGNRVRLREAFYNVISNATKFIDKQPAIIKISVRADARQCVFVIEDNGPGIPAGELTSIFAPFRRLKSHADQSGTGLGLYFTKHLVEEEGGRVWAESEPGQGSRFFIALPRSSADAATAVE